KRSTSTRPTSRRRPRTASTTRRPSSSTIAALDAGATDRRDPTAPVPGLLEVNLEGRGLVARRQGDRGVPALIAVLGVDLDVARRRVAQAEAALPIGRGACLPRAHPCPGHPLA